MTQEKIMQKKMTQFEGNTPSDIWDWLIGSKYDPSDFVSDVCEAAGELTEQILRKACFIEAGNAYRAILWEESLSKEDQKILGIKLYEYCVSYTNLTFEIPIKPITEMKCPRCGRNYPSYLYMPKDGCDNCQERDMKLYKFVQQKILGKNLSQKQIFSLLREAGFLDVDQKS